MPYLVTLHLKLDNPPDHVYRPRDLLSGSVWLRSDVEEEVKNVSIVLKGWTTVRFIELPRPTKVSQVSDPRMAFRVHLSRSIRTRLRG